MCRPTMVTWSTLDRQQLHASGRQTPQQHLESHRQLMCNKIKWQTEQSWYNYNQRHAEHGGATRGFSILLPFLFKMAANNKFQVNFHVKGYGIMRLYVEFIYHAELWKIQISRWQQDAIWLWNCLPSHNHRLPDNWPKTAATGGHFEKWQPFKKKVG